MRRTFTNLVFLIVLVACERVVEVEDPQPVETIFCSADEQLQNSWRTDSVWVVTEVDTLDSLIVNTSPGIFYDMDVSCGETKQFLLSYTGAHNITTVDVRSSNFETAQGRVFVYDPFDETQDTGNAEFQMPYAFTNDTLVNCTLTQNLGNGQRSSYYLFFRAL